MKKRFWLLILCMLMPFAFVGCESLNKDYLSAPKNVSVQADGIIAFERIDNDEYYVVNINGLEYNIFVATSNPYLELYNKNGINYLEYDMSRIFNLGEGYTIKVKACAKNKKDSDYSDTVSYVHKMHVDTPTTIITGTTLTWDNVYNASSYMVKVVTPSTTVESDDPDTIASSNIYSSQYSLNKFDFSSMLTEAGEYKFYVKAISRDSNYIESGYSQKIVYQNYITLSTPQNLTLHKVDNKWILTALIDPNANCLKLNLNGELEVVDVLDECVTKDEQCSNLVYINLNQAYKSKTIDFENLKTATVSCQACYETQTTNYYTNSSFSTSVVLNLKNDLIAPTISVDKNNILTWQNSNQSTVAGYNVYVCKSTGVEQVLIPAKTKAYQLPDDFVAVSVQILGYDENDSALSEFLFNSDAEQSSVVANFSGNNIVWTPVDDAYYVIETNEEVLVVTESMFDVLSVDYVITQFNITAISTNVLTGTIKLNPSYKIKLSQPQNMGFYSNNKFLLSFNSVENAVGYKVYIKDVSNDQNEYVCVQTIFAENKIDLSKYVTRGKEYSIQVQAVADKYGNYADSDHNNSVILTYNLLLDMPQFVTDSLGSPIKITNDGSKKYYLSFYGVDGAYKYEIMVNFNTKTVMNDNRSEAYNVDITDYLTVNGEVKANAYNITIRALPTETDTITQASKFNSYTYQLRDQLKEVSNIVVSDPETTDNKYILSFDLLDNAQNYSIDIVKLNDAEYVTYLATLTPKLSLPITNVKGAVDITDYVQQAGEYYIYVTAHPGADNSYYDSSDRSSEYAVVSKLQTLITPNDLKYANQSSSEFYIGWEGDSNADSYSVKVSTANGKEYTYKTTRTQLNINDLITVEGSYSFAVKSVVASNSESAKTYVSSPYSANFTFNYTYQYEQDFERYGVALFDKDVKYNFAVEDVTQLTNLLWYHLLYGVDSDYKLKIYVKTNQDETMKDAIKRLATEATNYQSSTGVSCIYNFDEDAEWLALLNDSNSKLGTIMGYLCKKLLDQYPEMAIVDKFECSVLSDQTTNQIFKLFFVNQLDTEKEFNKTYVSLKTSYANNFKYINKSLRRNINSAFGIDSKTEMEVSTTEQLFMAVQYGFKPVFVGDCEVAKKVYNNAKLVLTAICSVNMSEVEKTTAIFEWLEYAFDINLNAKVATVGAVDQETDISVWGYRAEFYLEGLLYNISQNENGDIVAQNRQATDESLSKAFVLLCGIEGIKVRKVNGDLFYKDKSTSTTQVHSWNKIYISVDDDEKYDWYNVDICYSDLKYYCNNPQDSYNMASHLFFLVSDSYMLSNLDFGESSNPVKMESINEYQIQTMPSSQLVGRIEKTYSYYANTTKTISFEDLKNIVRLEDFLTEITDKSQAESDSVIGLKYDSDASYREYLYAEYTEGSQQNISHLQAFALNMLLYGKSEMFKNSEGRGSFEVQIAEDKDYRNGTALITALTGMTNDRLNGSYKKDTETNIKIKTLSTYDKATSVWTIVVTMEYI